MPEYVVCISSDGFECGILVVSIDDVIVVYVAYNSTVVVIFVVRGCDYRIVNFVSIWVKDKGCNG